MKPEVLVVYLRSVPIQKVLKWCQNGSNHPRFEQSEIVELKLPDRLLDIQDDVVKKIDQGIQAHKEGLELLASAKRRVEALILGEG